MPGEHPQQARKTVRDHILHSGPSKSKLNCYLVTSCALTIAQWPFPAFHLTWPVLQLHPISYMKESEVRTRTQRLTMRCHRKWDYWSSNTLPSSVILMLKYSSAGLGPCCWKQIFPQRGLIIPKKVVMRIQTLSKYSEPSLGGQIKHWLVSHLQVGFLHVLLSTSEASVLY